MLVSVIVTTYNWPEALAKVLDAFDCQDDPHFEVIVADDGSTEATRDLINTVKAHEAYPLKHVWQEDDGFRAARCRNLAVAASSGALLVFIDGDCIPPKNFVSTHRALARKGYFTAGNRILLSQPFSDTLLSSPDSLAQYGLKNWWSLYRAGGCNRFHPAVKLPLGPIRRLGKHKWQKARTCNLAVWRADFVAVNGFDESFEGWGYEDSDLVIRLLHKGIYRNQGHFAVPVAHIWHQEQPRDHEKVNHERLEAILASDQYRAQEGLDQHLKSRKAGLTVLMIVKNEAHCIEKSLASVTWADQIVVLDSGSEDNTLALAKQYTNEVHETDWPGFGAQRNRALTYAKQDWVLFLDADEQVSPALKANIEALLAMPPEGISGFNIDRWAYFLGRRLKGGDWAKDKVLRLFLKDKGHYTEPAVHERCIVDGEILDLSAPLYHDCLSSLHEALSKMNQYSSLGAQDKPAKLSWLSFLKAWGHGFWTFIRAYIFRAGFIDGIRGYLVARLCAEGSFYKYAKRMFHDT